MKSIAISLGHNSSAVLIEDGQIIGGYEEERFTGKKADSSFPMLSIAELKATFGMPKDTNVYVGHWFIDGYLPNPNKYWEPNIIRAMFPNGSVDSLSADFTHHDSHLESAKVFAGEDFPDSYHAIVADGFGSFGECISIYEGFQNSHRILTRAFGFEKSMGMLYQYATAFMGMKMHNHEYKMLAYEVHIAEVLEPWQIENLDNFVQDTAAKYLQAIYNPKISNKFDPITDIAALPNVQHKINDLLTEALNVVEADNRPEFDMRVIVSYFVQSVVQKVIVTMVKMVNPTNLLVVGGLFYNVKLNQILSEIIPGKLCVMPLAGDQGAALGVYQAYKGDLEWPGHLNWGPRTLHSFPKVPGLIVVDDMDQAVAVMEKELNRSGFVNLVRGNMEYGPRALCNTSTIAIPDLAVTKAVNRMNDRTMEMPFAPVMTEEQAKEYFVDCHKIHKSLEYMIVTRSYRKGMGEKVLGAAHYYPKANVYTGRPQITSDPHMVGLLSKFGPLVNTSFNYHGVPIVRSPAQIVNTHEAEWRKAPDLKPTTVVVRS